ncbi:DUF4215 domain-containing protein [Nannocystis pusilla]|uniref:DUF4215 domain-containing protein n=1 Tax=Nannocystis pusilla TaxID=889268 RepID=A0A9X3J383_9BACT|nr:DUF4215 domain-containing protein [Nannocystis pusilla]MCY1012554.1 DUF4215 domain-containing protein [Nannocystis pusilla]
MTMPTDGMGSTSAPATDTDGVDDTTGTTSTGTTAGSDTDAPATDTTAVTTTEQATSAGTDGCPDGGLFCACYGNMTCNDGLVCENDVCVPESEPVCGDGMLAGMEECDNGAGNADTATCKSDCTLQKCGDGFLGPGEACDDGNAVDNDACSNACIAATCGDLVVQMGEACDDGNAVSTDACINCKAAVCGDTFVYAGVEQCDDGNASGGDGCSASCQIEAPQCGGNFTTGWCPQNGTNQQFTRCESVSNNNKTCNNPFIKYGTVENGVPAQHVGNDYNAWCTSSASPAGAARSATATARATRRRAGCSAAPATTRACGTGATGRTATGSTSSSTTGSATTAPRSPRSPASDYMAHVTCPPGHIR